MRRLSLVALGLLAVLGVSAGDSLYVHKKGGGVVSYDVAAIDSLTFTGKSNVVVSDTTKPMQVDSTQVVDIDGNVYQVVKIGSQVWMSEDLKTTRYSNGDKIATTCPPTLDISKEATPNYQWAWNGFECEVISHGRFYTWFVAGDDRNVCPTGWHVPSDKEWSTLISAVGGSTIVGGTTGGSALKDTTGWTKAGGTNSVGFSVKGDGYRDDIGPFDLRGEATHYWTSTWDPSVNTNGNGYPGVYRSFVDGDGKVYRYAHQVGHGFHIRCVMD